MGRLSRVCATVRDTMPRSNQLLHPPCPPVPTLQAATVVLVRDGASGALEVLMTRRSHRASFAPGAYVFPGGGIEAQDRSDSAHDQATRRPTQTQEHLTHALAAIRESFEELGVLLARHPDGRWAQASDIAALDRHAPFMAQCQALGLRPAADAMFVLAHWIAARDIPKRFDTPFLVARMPPAQEPQADEREQFEPVWVRPHEALQRHALGQFQMIFPTIRTLQHLQRYANSHAVFAALHPDERPLWVSCPRAGLRGGHEVRYMEHEPEYGELALVCPDGNVAHALDWDSTRPVALLKNLQRLTAPNPGIMTGPGTNSYIVGDVHTGYIVIDPGPCDTAHLQRLHDAAGGDIRMIVCTHSHADHAPGAWPLQQLCVQSGRARPAVVGLPSAPTARAGCEFVPDRVVHNGELLQLTALGPNPHTHTHTLEVIYTPGHAANHICVLLREDGILFSGDHILSGATPVIDPPDGDMTAYLDSLDVLNTQCAAHDVQFIAPAHGYVLEGARAVIAQLKAHRLAREAKVAAAIQALPHAGPAQWVAHAYADVAPTLWPVAQRSLLAHVQRLQQLR